MFLTRMAMDINRPDTASILADRARLGAEVDALMPGMLPLWRLDQIGSRVWLVMLTRLRPDLLAMHLRYGYPGAFPSWETLSIHDELEELWPGERRYFELTFSPNGLTDRPDPSFDEPRLRAWLAEQGEHCGFTPTAVDTWSFSWEAVGGRQLLLARCRGRLRVTDESRFVWAVTHGIGGVREYGAGLMTIARDGSVWE